MKYNFMINNSKKEIKFSGFRVKPGFCYGQTRVGTLIATSGRVAVANDTVLIYHFVNNVWIPKWVPLDKISLQIPFKDELLSFKEFNDKYNTNNDIDMYRDYLYTSQSGYNLSRFIIRKIEEYFEGILEDNN